MKFLIILFISQISLAQVLLVPDQTISFESYKEKCQKEGYICTMNFQFDQIQKNETPQLNTLLDQLDYSSESFKNNFTVNLFKILKEEDISLDQVEVLLKITQELKEFADSQKQKQFLFIEKQLTEIIQIIKNSELSDFTEEFLIIFKKAVPLSFIKKLKPDSIKFKITKASFNHPLQVLNLNNKSLSTQYLVDGFCDKASLHPSLQIQKWQIESKKSCGLTETFLKLSHTTTDFVSDHQTALITTGLVLVGSAFLFNNYEIKFNF